MRSFTRTLTETRRQFEGFKEKATIVANTRQRCRKLAAAIEEETMKYDSENDQFSLEHAGESNSEQNIDPDALYAFPSGQNEDAKKESTVPVHLLRARVIAYKSNMVNLKVLATALKERSTKLEEKCRRVVALCTGVEEHRVDSLLEGLVTAVESDGHVEDISLLEGFVQAVNQN